MLRSVSWNNSLRKLQAAPLYLSKAFFHPSTVLCKDYREECPVSGENFCKPLVKKSCSPTDPSVRPCSEDECEAKPRYPCCVSTRISKNPCEKSFKTSDFKPKPDAFVSMWSTADKKDARPEYMWDYPPECCPKCEETRFDMLYYRPSDKCRKYQRTWWECCPRMVPKRMCCWCDAVPPQVLRRCPPICPRSACSNEHEKKRMECLNKKAKDCMRLRMPCCRAARVPPSCFLIKRPTDCKKIKCPFPSFSECAAEDLATLPERPAECRCLETMSTCLRNRYAERLNKHAISMYPCPKSC